MTTFYHFYYRIQTFAARHRLFAAFVSVLISVVFLDEFFHLFFYDGYLVFVEQLLGSPIHAIANVDMSFTPEVWLALLSMVLGTLIIVISIASQSIPKLIDLYMEDWPSLLYIWFLIISGFHATFIKLYGEMSIIRPSSRILNIHFLLTISVILSFPYIFYILKYTKPSNVINKIFTSNLARIYSLRSPHISNLLNMPYLVEAFQSALFESMNQLDDLLEYVPFKEPKADIIHSMSITIQEYVKIKSTFNPHFFKVSPRVRSDISFKTMIGQFGDMEESHTFFEQKCFRLLANVYLKLLEQEQFELSSLCVAEMTSIGRTAIEVGDDQLIDTLIIRFNTILRYGMKHGEKNNEPRNLYNAVYHYGNFINDLVDSKKINHTKQCFGYLQFYGIDIFKRAQDAASGLNFIVHILADEMRKLLIRVYKEGWDLDIQKEFLNHLLQVDSPPDFDKEDLDRGQMMSSGVRVIQMGLALFYMKEKQDDFVETIIADVLDDLEVLGETAFRRMTETTCGQLKFQGPKFWEDTDRGNLNIYYISDQDQIDPFKAKMFERMTQKLLDQVKINRQLENQEALLFQQLSLGLGKIEIMDLTKKPEIFEKMVLALESIEAGTLTTLNILRSKLGFTSVNPDLQVSNTRQIAINTKLKVLYQDPQKGELYTTYVKIKFTDLNYFSVEFLQEGDQVDWQEFIKVIFQFKPLQQKRTYQFESKIEEDPLNEGLYRIFHVYSVNEYFVE